MSLELSFGDHCLSHASRVVAISERTAESARVFRVVSEDGYEIKATEWHDFYTDRGKIKLHDLTIGDSLWVQSGKGQFGNEGSEDLGTLLGLINIVLTRLGLPDSLISRLSYGI